MKKQKLALRKETIRPLQVEELAHVGGGSDYNCKVIGTGACNSGVSLILSRCGGGVTDVCNFNTLACGFGGGSGSY